MDINLINEEIKKDTAAFIKESERSYYAQIEKIAQDVSRRTEQRPIILICGPSGSGKTTTALALEHMLDNMGHNAHTISMDNYFRTLTPKELELASRGELDLESPSRLDISLLNSQLADMADGKPVLIPKYDFRKSERIAGVRTVSRKEGEIVIVEGIHSLNPDVVTIPDDRFGSIYVSVRTRVTEDNFVLHPERIRLLRRMLRDNSHRGRSFDETLDMYSNVQRGENLYIMPFKRRAHYEVDTFIAYELNVYKNFLADYISGNNRLQDLQLIMEIAENVDEKFTPGDSLIREFIGGSNYEY